MNKKGMTLAELLAVIGILSILILLVLPNAIGALKDSKKKNFLTDVQTICKTAIAQSKVDNYGRRGSISYGRKDGHAMETYEELELSGGTQMDFVITIERDGTVSYFVATDGEYQFVLDNPIDDASLILEEQIKEVSELGEEEIAHIEEAELKK